MSAFFGDPFNMALIALGGGLGPLVFFAVRRLAGRRTRLSERLSGTGQKHASGQHRQARLDWVQGIGKMVSPKQGKALSAIRLRLMHAGFIGKNAPAWYYGARLVLLIGALAALMLLWPLIGDHVPFLPAAIITAIAAHIAPGFWLDKRQARLQSEYRNGFPDMMDLLVACVQAGLSLDAGINRVAEEIGRRYPNLNTHLGIMSLELRAGRSRTEALSGFAQRLGLDEARAFATMLRQSEEMGTSLSTTLRVFADDMREKRMLYAEEKALALPAKLVVPLILFVFPSLLGVLMLPAGVRLFWVFGSGGP